MKPHSFWSLNWNFFVNAWRFLVKNKDLFWLMILSIVAVVLVAVVLIALEGYLALSHAALALMIVSALIGFLLLSFVAQYFQGALISCIAMRIQNKDGSLASGLKVAARQWFALLGWTAIEFTVGAVLRALESSHNILEDIVAVIVGVAWAVASFFALPFIVLEQQGSISGLKSSMSLCKNIWQGRMRSRVRVMSLFFLLLCLLLIPLGFVVFELVGLTVIQVYFVNHVLAASISIIALFTILSLIARAFHAVVVTSLFLFYTKPGMDTTIMPYHTEYLQQAFRLRRGMTAQ